jgi:hypothetical protein
MKVWSHEGLRRRRSSGLTLAEVMVATGLGSLVLLCVAALTLYGARSSAALVNYNDLDARSRYALDVISREFRQATGVVAQNNSAIKSVTLTNAAQGLSSKLTWDRNTRTLVLERTGEPDLTALTECDSWNVSFYQRTPLITATNVIFYPATNTFGLLDFTLCKLVDMSWKCSRQIMAQKVNTESVQAAQIVLRNKR